MKQADNTLLLPSDVEEVVVMVVEEEMVVVEEEEEIGRRLSSENSSNRFKVRRVLCACPSAVVDGAQDCVIVGLLDSKLKVSGFDPPVYSLQRQMPRTPTCSLMTFIQTQWKSPLIRVCSVRAKVIMHVVASLI